MSNPPFSDGGFSVYGVVIKRLRSKNVKAFYTDIIVKQVIIFMKEIIHIQQIIITHIEDIGLIHPFRRILYILFSEFLYTLFIHG